jgi:hypothetical protein
VKTDVRVRLDYMQDGGKPVLRWSGSESVRTQTVCLCDVLDFHFYMSDRKEKLKYGKEATLPSVHYMAKGKRIPGFEGLAPRLQNNLSRRIRILNENHTTKIYSRSPSQIVKGRGVRIRVD